ncbi:MAG: plasmid partitioning protein RepB, partial [Mesorhizobium sp.]
MAGQNRKNQLKALFQAVEPPSGERAAAPPTASPVQAPAPSPETRARTASGAIKAMGLSLDGLSREIEDARRLKESLGTGERIIEIEPELIDSSFVSDRLGHDDGDEGFLALVQSIETSGQQ